MHHDQEQRYARQISLPEIGMIGQHKLMNAKVLVIGAGGLGSPLLLYLASAGVGEIGIVDDDRVEISNLGRQIIYETADVGRPKAESAKDALVDINPDIRVTVHHLRLAEDTKAIITHYDIVADGTDNFATRYLVADACNAAEKPLISAAILGWNGQISTFMPYAGRAHPCYRCWHPEPNGGAQDVTCSASGVLGSAAGIVGSWQATEVIKTILNVGESLSGSVLLVDALNASTRKLVLPPDPACGCQR
jgi:adenylyltransferase/sulfurtransferase